jgi:GMP reductase
MRIETEIKLGFKDVMIRPKRSTLRSRSEVDLNRSFEFRNSKQSWSGVPIMAANMDTVGTFDAARILGRNGLLTAIHKHNSLEDWRSFLQSSDNAIISNILVSTGTSQNDYDQTNKILSLHPGLTKICVDVANGYSEHFVDFVKRMRDSHPHTTLVAGNVVTGEMVEELILAGADIVKVGIGPGSVCTTRMKTGVGYPQISAIIDCADAAHGLGGQIIADGGCTCPGDVSKAFGAGADFVMLGGMLAGHEENGGRVIEKDGVSYMEFYGMSSTTAMDKYSGGVANYRASEGKTVLIPFKGSMEGTINDILGGVRSTCTYVGAKRLKELTKRTTFIRVLEQENRIYGKNS